MKKKVKILYVIETLSSKGGAERVLINLIKELVNYNYNISVAVLGAPYDLEKELLKIGVTVYHINLNHRWNIISACFKLKKICNKHKFDILHAHLFFAEIYVALSYFYYPIAIRAATYHNLGYEAYPALSLWEKIRKWIHSFSTNRFMDNIYAVSISSSESYKYHLKIKKQIKVMYNGIPIENLLLLKSTDLPKENKEEFAIILPGRLVKEKGQKILIESISLLRERNLTPKVLLIGDGPLESFINLEIISHELSNQIRIISTLPQSELHQIMVRSQLVVLPSFFEGLPTVLIEAAVLGIPIISTFVGGIPEIIKSGESGLLVKKGNALLLAEAIEYMILNEDFRNVCSKKAKSDVTAMFDVKKIASRWSKEYPTILKRGQGNK